jgi:hypothetical protein
MFIQSVGLRSLSIRASLLDPLRVDVFSMVHGRCTLFYQDALTVCDRCTVYRVHGSGGAMRSCRYFIGSAFMRALVLLRASNVGRVFLWFAKWCGGLKAIRSAFVLINKGLPFFWSLCSRVAEPLLQPF